MTEDLLRRLAMFVVLCLAQVLIVNHIHLFGVAIPLLYIYFVITFRRGTPKWMILLWGFFMGLWWFPGLQWRRFWIQTTDSYQFWRNEC